MSLSKIFFQVSFFLMVSVAILFVFVPSSITLAAPGGQPASGNPGGQPSPGNSGGSENTSFSIANPLKVDSITEFLVAVIEIILVFAVPIIVLYIMYAGFLFVTANGESGQLEKARNALLFALVGGVIILGAFVIIDIIKGTVDNITN